MTSEPQPPGNPITIEEPWLLEWVTLGLKSAADYLWKIARFEDHYRSTHDGAGPW